ncbi:hypothetical protein AVEN_183996-1 [Araneus ventricosus]|uniref:Uncharacterized protein n=1 Tax=Araneus ventricosus TaxID=182803 RepID=A0A4Y2E0J2_ARAVE|nr:hypothetical protein AVEN_183996-1 [Araneus ventricosus]
MEREHHDCDAGDLIKYKDSRRNNSTCNPDFGKVFKRGKLKRDRRILWWVLHSNQWSYDLSVICRSSVYHTLPEVTYGAAEIS